MANTQTGAHWSIVKMASFPKVAPWSIEGPKVGDENCPSAKIQAPVCSSNEENITRPGYVKKTVASFKPETRVFFIYLGDISLIRLEKKSFPVLYGGWGPP